jgi:hypothetical protein
VAFDKEILRALRADGFKRASRCLGGGGEVVEYERWHDDRRVDVQLWDDGGHRVSNALIIEGDRCRLIWSTTPTSFRTVEAMRTAIEIETARADHAPVGRSRQ